MSDCRSVDPAFVDGTTAQTRPARYASYPPLTPGEVAYLPVWSREGTGQSRHESALFKGAAGDVAAATAVAKGSPFMQAGSEAESRAMGIIKNLPSRCREEEVVDVISKLGFGSYVTAFIMPTRAGRGNRRLNKGYAFVYFYDEMACQGFVEAASGYRGLGEHPAGRAISVTFSVHFGECRRGTSSAGSSEGTEDEMTKALPVSSS